MAEDNAIILSKQEITTQDFAKHHNKLLEFVKSQLRESKDIKKGGDYGVIPYTNKKSLLKPGAEKLLKLFNLVATFDLIKEVEDWDNKFVYYRYKCTITHPRTGIVVADAIRSCNNREAKHRTKDVYDVANTIQSVAQKRALVAATVQATMASEIFDATTTDEGNEEPPGKPANREDDPDRVRILARFFATVQERGFSSDAAKKQMYKNFSVETMADISNKDITETTEKLIAEWEPVEKGKKPRRIGASPSPSVEDGEVVEDAGEDKKKDPSEDDSKPTGQENKEEDTTTTQEIKCYGCGNTIKKEEERYKDYFHNEDCHWSWYEKTYPAQAKKIKREKEAKQQSS